MISQFLFDIASGRGYSDIMMQRLRRLTFGVVPLVVLILPLLTPMAYASPPDPSWIYGLYDGGDFDDVVVLVTSGAGVVELGAVVDVSTAPPPVSWLVPCSDRPVSTESPGSLHSRAPPAR